MWCENEMTHPIVVHNLLTHTQLTPKDTKTNRDRWFSILH